MGRGSTYLQPRLELEGVEASCYEGMAPVAHRTVGGVVEVLVLELRLIQFEVKNTMPEFQGEIPEGVQTGVRACVVSQKRAIGLRARQTWSKNNLWKQFNRKSKQTLKK